MTKRLVFSELNTDTGGYDIVRSFDSCMVTVGDNAYHLSPGEVPGSLRISRMERGALAIKPIVNNCIELRPEKP